MRLTATDGLQFQPTSAPRLEAVGRAFHRRGRGDAGRELVRRRQPLAAAVAARGGLEATFDAWPAALLERR